MAKTRMKSQSSPSHHVRKQLRENHSASLRCPGGTDFAFKNDHAGTTPGLYSADKWISPAPSPGDLVLSASCLMHAVPPNLGDRRIAMAFNAIPARLESWGCTITFGG